ncbi:MAG TPA: holo-ACP synthase [Candidatus Bilophila faecipullorum]|uniref:Holo-[acyl-carrier-protein] synthase n=1 Tax=Candidatus Bilophila faecipullorum TaxID=2838482 RepID=A0A9D1R083_9BACT|nr:holo-ACP synthase [uncultured Bilophila sp.]HIW78519.1 holo-ACP synthase [Candidatus Bilophila faecipullorum]
MGIIGIGLDMVELSRIERSLRRFGEHFLDRIMDEEERRAVPGDTASPSSRLTAHVAARFAAKEAAVKALGTGFAAGIGPRDVAVRSLPSGKPELVLSGAALEKARALGASRVHLTLTHTRDNAAAVVILEQ